MKEKNAKDKIIETTIQMIEKKGYSKITTNHIAKNAEVSIGTLYYHFEKGKTDIIKEIVKRGYAEFLDDSKLESLTRSDLPEFLRSFLTQFLEKHRENKSLLIAIETELITNRRLFQDYQYIQSELKFVPLISKLLKQLGYDHEEDPDKVSKFLLFAIDSIIHRHLIYGEILINDEDLITNLINLITRFIQYNKIK
jgi:AcrR family transcriptional regulator